MLHSIIIIISREDKEDLILKKVRWGILSTATIAQEALIPAFQRSVNAEVKAIASSSGLNKAETVAAQFQIDKAYGSYEELLADPNIDAVYIPLPNHLHKEWVIQAAQHKKHILCEKPASLHADEFEEMRSAVIENDVLFLEAFMYYFHPQHDRVKQIIDQGEIGEVSYMQAGFTFYLPEEERSTNIRTDRKKGGGSLYDIGCYTVHSIRNIIRKEPETVHVQAVIDEESKVDTDTVGYITFPNGVRASFDTSFNLEMRQEYRIFGTKGKIYVPRAFRPDLHGGEGIIIIENETGMRIETIYGDQYRLQVEHISQAILEGKKELKLDMANTYENMKVIDACYESIASAKQVKIKR